MLYSSKSKGASTPQGTYIRKGKEAAEETREETENGNLTAPIWLFQGSISFTPAEVFFAFGKLSWIQNYLFSSWEPRCNYLNEVLLS